MTLDSTYQVLDLDPWYTTTVVTARRAFAQACTRSVACAAATRGGRAWARISALAARLARAPVTGETTLPSGRRGTLTVTVLTLVNLINNAGFDPVVYRDLDAAGRALLYDHDAAPLLRIAALSLGFDDTNYSLPEYSDGLYFAVGCTDYVQLFSRTAPPAVRARQYRAALRREPRDTFAPFSLAQWTSLDQYTEAYSACLRWPSPARLFPPIVRKPPLVPRAAAGADHVRNPGLADAAAARRDAGSPADGPLGTPGDVRQPDPRHAPGRQRRLPRLGLSALHPRSGGTCSTRTSPARAGSPRYTPWAPIPGGSRARCR